jgi:hypothetical protein
MSAPPSNAASKATTGYTARSIASYCDPTTLKDLRIVNREFAAISKERKQEFNVLKENIIEWQNTQYYVYPSIYHERGDINSVGITICKKKTEEELLFCPFIELLKETSDKKFITEVRNVPATEDSKYEFAHVHPIAFKKMLEFTKTYLTIKNCSEYEDYIKIIDEALAKFPKCEALERSCGPMGGAKKKQYTTYNNKKYQVKIGSRGGKYIIVNGQKHYIK